MRGAAWHARLWKYGREPCAPRSTAFHRTIFLFHLIIDSSDPWDRPFDFRAAGTYLHEVHPDPLYRMRFPHQATCIIPGPPSASWDLTDIERGVRISTGVRCGWRLFQERVKSTDIRSVDEWWVDRVHALSRLSNHELNARLPLLTLFERQFLHNFSSISFSTLSPALRKTPRYKRKYRYLGFWIIQSPRANNCS